MARSTLLYFIIFLEGYVVLASELLAIRQLLPFVGSGTEVVALIISAVLLPLAAGYYHAGRVRRVIRKRLLRNFLLAFAWLWVALSTPLLEVFFAGLTRMGIVHPVAQTACYGLLLLVYPVYLLGQTVPLLSNYFGRARLSEATGRVLFMSTLGSFVGSVFSTLVLMQTIGVHATVICTLTLMLLALLLIQRRVLTDASLCGFILWLLVVATNSPASLRAMHVVSDNAYNTVTLREDKATQARYLLVNRSNSSGLGRDNVRIFPYIQYIEQQFIAPTQVEHAPARDILVLGAGGFTLGLDDAKNRYQFVDIDPALKKVSEQHFLHEPLGANKQFVAASARAYVRRAPKSYDLIVVDTFTNVLSAPMETTTREFLLEVKKLLKPGGILVVNQAASADFKDRFSVRYDRTFADVFGVYTRQVIGNFDPWHMPHQGSRFNNVLYIYYDRPGLDDSARYEDDRNTYALDHY